MENNILGTKWVAQIGILVHDIEKTSQAFADFFGVHKPQWSITDTVDKAQTSTEGRVPKQERSWRSLTWGRFSWN